MIGAILRALVALVCLSGPAFAQAAPPRQSIPNVTTQNQFWTLGQSRTPDTSVFVNGAYGPRPYTWNASAGQAGVATSFYMPCCRDPIPGVSGHDYKWFLNNHPDWVVWGTSDPVGNPQATVTTTAAASSGATSISVSDASALFVGMAVVGTGVASMTFISAISGTTVTLDTPLSGALSNGATVKFYHPLKDVTTSTYLDVDIANPDVRQYMLDYALASGVGAGMNYVGLDNFQASNSTGGRVGSYAGSAIGCPAGPPACGGSFVQQFAYPIVQYDPIYAAAQIDYARWMRSHINARGIGFTGNVKSDRDGISASIQLALNFDVVLHESPYLHGCAGSATDLRDNSSGYWTANSQFFTALVQAGIPVMSANYLCNNPTATITLPEAIYGIASFMLYRGSNSAFEVQGSISSGGTGADSGSYLDYTNLNGFNLNQAWGAAASTAPIPGTPNSSGGCYERRFAQGLVEVWPLPTGSCTYTVPAGTWVDFTGNAVTPGVKTLSPDTSVSPNRANAVILRKTG